jgi:hypothetical protein
VAPGIAGQSCGGAKEGDEQLEYVLSKVSQVVGLRRVIPSLLNVLGDVPWMGVSGKVVRQEKKQQAP